MMEVTGKKKLESNAVGVGMVIAAAMMSEWDDVRASEILHAAGLTTVKDMRRVGCDDYDIDKLRSVIKDIAMRKEWAA